MMDLPHFAGSTNKILPNLSSCLAISLRELLETKRLCVLCISVSLVSTALSNLPNEFSQILFHRILHRKLFSFFSLLKMVPGRISRAFRDLFKKNFSNLSVSLHFIPDL